MYRKTRMLQSREEVCPSSLHGPRGADSYLDHLPSSFLVTVRPAVRGDDRPCSSGCVNYRTLGC